MNEVKKFTCSRRQINKYSVQASGLCVIPENRIKHLEFTFARREVCFLLSTFENVDKYFSLYLHRSEC